MLVRELREEALDEDLLLLREEVRGDGAEDPSGFGAVSIPAGVQTWSRIRTEGGRTHTFKEMWARSTLEERLGVAVVDMHEAGIVSGRT
jgi:hypothetical protein